MKINFCAFFMLIGLGSINLNETLKASNAIPNAIPNTIPAVPVFKQIGQKNQHAGQPKPPKKRSKKSNKDEIYLFFIGLKNTDDVLYSREINWSHWSYKIIKIARTTQNNSLKNDHKKLHQWASQVKENGIKKDSLETSTIFAVERFAFFTAVFGRSKDKKDALDKFAQFARLYQFKEKKEKEFSCKTLKIIFKKISKQATEDLFNILLSASKRQNAGYIPSPMEFISDIEQKNNLDKTNFALNWDSKDKNYWKLLIQKWFYRGHIDNFSSNEEEKMLGCFVNELKKNRSNVESEARLKYLKLKNKKKLKIANIDPNNPSQMGPQPDDPSKKSSSHLVNKTQSPRKNKRSASHHRQSQALSNAQIEPIQIYCQTQPKTPTLAHRTMEKNLTLSHCLNKKKLTSPQHSSERSQIDTGRRNSMLSQYSREQSQALSNSQIEIIQAPDIEIQTNQSETIIDVAKESPKQEAINKPKDSFFQRICCCLAPKRPKAV